MKSLLLASVAAVSLALAGAANAQTETLPTPPPIQTPAETPDRVAQGEVAAAVQAPEASAPAVPAADATPAAPDATVTAETPAVAATAEVSPAEAAQNATAMAATTAAPVTPTPAATTDQAAAVVPASAASVCQARVTSVHFGARGSSLSQQNRNAIEQAVDAASVCDLQQVVIADSGEGRVSTRRAETVRATLIRQGVPAERISVEAAANAEGASTGQLDVRMMFAGVAQSGQPAAANEAAPTPPPAS